MSTAVDTALANPAEALLALQKIRSERSLFAFVKAGWPSLEPETKFISGWAVEAICEHLEAVTRGEIKRLLINVPPGCTKSMTVNVFWPAWEWGPLGRSSTRYISAAYGQNLSIRDMLRCRDLINSEWYQELWGDRFDWKGDQNSKLRYENTKTGFRLASSVSASMIGQRAQRLIVDDPHDAMTVESDQVRSEAIRWFSETLPTRLNNLDEDAIVVIMQRVHELDVSGHILEHDLGYTHLCLPMEYEPDHPFVWADDPRTEPGELLWPERFSAVAIERQKKEFRSWGGTYAEAGQLQQRPAPRGGGMFKRDWWNIVDSPPEKFKAMGRGWDLAATDDKKNAAWTVGMKMCMGLDGNVYIMDVIREQASPSRVEAMITGCAGSDGPRCTQDIPQDPGQAGKHQKACYAKILHGHDFRFSPETGSKEDRARPLAAQAENGNVFLVRGSWNDEFIHEAETFPNSRFKDQVDAASRAYACLVLKSENRGYHSVGSQFMNE